MPSPRGNASPFGVAVFAKAEMAFSVASVVNAFQGRATPNCTGRVARASASRQIESA